MARLRRDTAEDGAIRPARIAVESIWPIRAARVRRRSTRPFVPRNTIETIFPDDEIIFPPLV
jgi:hypothetical protein